MKSKSNLLIKEEGSVLIVALLILVVLTMIGISSTTTTEIEIQIAGNEQFHRIAFYGADSGILPEAFIISLRPVHKTSNLRR